MARDFGARIAFAAAEVYDFLHSEMVRTRENSFRVQAGVVRVTGDKVTVTAGVCVAAIGDPNVIRDILECNFVSE
jgi:hypothetical protein